MGTHFLDPDWVGEEHPHEQSARKRLDDIAANWGCEAVEHEPLEFRFEGPEEGEIQGYARLREPGHLSAGEHNFTPSEDIYDKHTQLKQYVAPPEYKDPDEHQDPFDPRLLGASKMFGNDEEYGDV